MGPAARSDLLLASRSPRRAVLLEQLRVDFQPVDVAIDEALLPGEEPKSYVERLAAAKARAGWVKGGSVTPALGADTIVVSGSRILGKPAGDSEASDMLARLSGRWHEVYSAVAVCADVMFLVCVASRVRFRELSQAEIIAYIRTGEPRDKAGAYAIQGLAAAFVDRLEGSYSAVVGLPLCETAALLSRAGVRHGLTS